MNKSEQFLEAIQQGQRLTADGATGTNLQQRGLPAGQPSDLWTLENPKAILQLHRDFITAGSDIILTNTFGAKSLQLKRFNLDSKVMEMNSHAVELAREAAADKPVFVAASIGPIGTLLKPFGPLEESEAREMYLEQIKALVEADVDLFVVETQYDLAEAKLVVHAIRTLSDKPVVLSFSYDRGVHTMMGVKPHEVAEMASALSVTMVGINCGRSLEENLTVLKDLRASTDLPIWFKPNAGLPKTNPGMPPDYLITPEGMGALVPAWIAAGAQVVGGCCGTSPAHLAKIHDQLIKLPIG